MNRYDILRTNFFKDKIPDHCLSKDWLEDEKCPFFLNSNCKIFAYLDLKKLSKILDIDITAYAFRRIVCTWALTHKKKEIREAEEEALQHSVQVAKQRNLQSNQVVPQTLVQTYTQEENIFPAEFKEQFQNDAELDTIILAKKEQRKQARHLKLLKEKDDSNKIRFEMRPLGPRNSILETDRGLFAEYFESSTGTSLDILLKFKPIVWRDTLVDCG